MILIFTLVLFGSALSAHAGCVKGCQSSSAWIQECTLVFDSYFPPAKSDPETVYVKLYDNGSFITEKSATGDAGFPYEVTFDITQLYTNQDVSFIVADASGDGNGYIFWDYTLGGESDYLLVADVDADPCIQKHISTLDCPYPPSPLLGQGRVVDSSPVTYYAPDLNATTIPAVVLPEGSSWWIVEARDGFYKLFIACRGRYIWITADSLGPNFDVVWKGQPLPDAGSAATPTPTA